MTEKHTLNVKHTFALLRPQFLSASIRQHSTHNRTGTLIMATMTLQDVQDAIAHARPFHAPHLGIRGVSIAVCSNINASGNSAHTSRYRAHVQDSYDKLHARYMGTDPRPEHTTPRTRDDGWAVYYVTTTTRGSAGEHREEVVGYLNADSSQRGTQLATFYRSAAARHAITRGLRAAATRNSARHMQNS